MYDRVYDNMTKYTAWLCALYLPPVILSALGLPFLAVLYLLIYLSVVIKTIIKRNRSLIKSPK